VIHADFVKAGLSRAGIAAGPVRPSIPPVIAAKN